MTNTPELNSTKTIIFFLAGVIAVGSLLFSVYGDRRDSELTVGEPSPVTFAAPVDLDVIDEVGTAQQRLAVRAQIDEIYHIDRQAQQLVLAAISAAALPDDVLVTLLENFAQPEGVRAAQLPEIIDEAVSAYGDEEAAALRAVLMRRLLPTSIPDQNLTEAARNAAASAIAPVLESIPAGQPIVREGEPLTANQLSLLQATGLYDVQADDFRQGAVIVAGCLLLGGLFALALMLVWRFLAPTVSPQQFLFLGTLTLVVFIAQRYALGISQNFIFIMLLPLITSILVSRTVALAWAAWSAVLLALLVPAGPEFALVAGFVGSVAVAWFAPQQRSRTALLLAGALSSGLAVLALVATSLVLGGYTLLATVSGSAWLVAGGAVAGLLSMALLPLAEHQFRFLTDFRLLELSNPGAPLLQRLLLEAPGTYQHSLVISNMVGQAVERIGGDALLARVGALYHDVGKLKRPGFFVENQFAGENPHDKLSPHLSYLIITAHVRDGVELLKEYNLPQELISFAQEHHGTTILTYFYKRALEATPSLDELNFRYPGPRPKSRETAVLMLADAVESASRTLRDANQGEIRALIDRLVDQRLRDGQLSDSNLHFDDLEKIKSTFERLLSAILHRRVSYPTPEEIGRLKRGTANVSDTAAPLPLGIPQRAES